MGVPRLVLGFLKFRISIVEAVRLHGCASAGFRICEILNFELSEFKHIQKILAVGFPEFSKVLISECPKCQHDVFSISEISEFLISESLNFRLVHFSIFRMFGLSIFRFSMFGICVV